MLCTWQEKTSNPAEVVQIAICQCGQRNKQSSGHFNPLWSFIGKKKTSSDDRKLEKTRGMGSLPQIHPFRLILTNGY